MATPRSQRIGIWIIAVAMVAGTLGSFLVMALSLQNQKIDQADQQKLIDDYTKQQKEAVLLNEPLTSYVARTFDPASVTKLNVEVLGEGTGDVVKATDSINSSYFGWTSDGKIFDSSKKKSTADAPITFSLAQVIPGWTEGLTGVKVGSTVRLTIPSDKAYGVQGSPPNIGSNAPLEFIVQIHKIDNSAA